MPIKFHDVFYTYLPKSPYEHTALKGVSFEIKDGEFIGIIGHTGSGKSTLVQHINALLLPSSGEIEVDNFLIAPDTKPKGVKNLRKKAGLVFQFPEYQLFEETVFKDIAFGPKNFGATEQEIRPKVEEIMKLLGLDLSYLDKSPFELSGGQKRRVAIAGILAINPDILVLDEPTAGLDPKGAIDTLDLFKKLNKDGKTIVLVTHEMDYVLQYCDKVIVLKDGVIEAFDSPINIFMNKRLLERVGIEEPLVIKIMQDLINSGMKLDYWKIKDVSSLVDQIVKSRGDCK